jgi:hypothetical protein
MDDSKCQIEKLLTTHTDLSIGIFPRLARLLSTPIVFLDALTFSIYLIWKIYQEHPNTTSPLFLARTRGYHRRKRMWTFVSCGQLKQIRLLGSNTLARYGEFSRYPPFPNDHHVHGTNFGSRGPGGPQASTGLNMNVPVVQKLQRQAHFHLRH